MTAYRDRYRRQEARAQSLAEIDRLLRQWAETQQCPLGDGLNKSQEVLPPRTLGLLREQNTNCAALFTALGELGHCWRCMSGCIGIVPEEQPREGLGASQSERSGRGSSSNDRSVQGKGLAGIAGDRASLEQNGHVRGQTGHVREEDRDFKKKSTGDKNPLGVFVGTGKDEIKGSGPY